MQMESFLLPGMLYENFFYLKNVLRKTTDVYGMVVMRCNFLTGF